ncbi:MAG TPA: hypothetical protein VID70_09560 [Solirubrobacteraceae bacterium]|jgi:hypothetical protein
MSVTAPTRQTTRRKRPNQPAEQSTRLASYTTPEGEREIISTPGANGSTLVIDRDRVRRSDERLIARIHPDEPAENAGVMCELYLAERPARRFCRPVTREDRDANAAPTPRRWTPGDAWTLVQESALRRTSHPGLP